MFNKSDNILYHIQCCFSRPPEKKRLTSEEVKRRFSRGYAIISIPLVSVKTMLSLSFYLNFYRSFFSAPVEGGSSNFDSFPLSGLQGFNLTGLVYSSVFLVG